MNKKIASLIAKLILILIAILLVTIIWDYRYIPDLFKKPVDYNIIDPSTGEKYTHEKKLMYVLSPKIDSLINKDNPEKALELIDSIMPEYQNNRNLNYQKGLSLAMIDSFELAITYFDKTMSFKDSLEELKQKKGLRYINSLHYKYECLAALEKYDKALIELNRLLTYNSDYKIDIAYMHELRKDYRTSIKYYKSIKNDYKQSEDSLRLWREIRDLTERIDELEKIID